MVDDALPLDGAIAAFLTDVLDDLLGLVDDEESIRSTLARLGLEGADADALAAHLLKPDQQAAIGSLRDELPALLQELTKPKPNLVTLIMKVPGLVKAVTDLARDPSLPNVSLPAVPDVDAGSVLDVLLAMAVERTLQAKTAAGWSVAKALHLAGPELPIPTLLSDLMDSPIDFVWRRFNALRRHLDITIAGVITGPRTLSVVTVPISPSDSIDATVQAAVPDADVILQRITLRLAADTYDAPHAFTIEALGHGVPGGGLPDFAAVALTSEAVAAPIHLSGGVTIHLDPLESAFGIAVTGYGDVVPIAAGTPALTLGSDFKRGFTFGQQGGFNLVLAGPVLDPHVSPTDWGLRAGFESFELTIPPDIAGPILALLLPHDGVKLKGKLIIAADGNGIHAEGGIGLKTTWPDTLRLPGLLVRGLTTEITTTGSTVTLVAAGTITVDLGVLTVTVEGLGMKQPVELKTDGSGSLGLIDLGAPSLNPPTGLGVSIDAGIVKGGGFMRIEEHGVSGALELALKLGTIEIAVRAVGVIESVEGRLSFVVVMSVEFSPAIELFLGLTLNAVGGIFGVNRTMDIDALTATVRSGRMSDVMFPHDLASRAVEVIASVKQVFPARVGQVVVGPMLKLGWGRPVSFVSVSVGIVLTLPDPVVIAIIGSLRIGLPAPDVAVIDIRADFSGTIDASSGEVRFDASLANSRIATFDVTGDIALRAGPSGFLFTAGGFYPGFPVPAGLGEVRRLGISIAPSPILSIRADAYFAVTASTVQFGGGLAVVAELGPIDVTGHLGLDVLIRLQPLSFVAELHGQFRLSFEGEDILSADLDVLLEGPQQWHARAHAEISFLFFSVSGSLELRWGDSASPPPPAVLVAQEVHRALGADPVWAHVLPAADGALVTIRDGASALHPLGRLRLTQTVAPLGVPLAHFGSAKVSDAGPVKVSVTADLAEPAPTDDLFAAAQFFELSDEEKISKPAFVPYLAGYTLQGGASAPLADSVVGDVVYEESSGESRPPAGGRHLHPIGEELLGLVVLGAAGRSNGQGVPVVGPLADLKVRPTTYGVVNAATGVLDEAGLGVGKAFAASARKSVDAVVMADYELAGLIG
jgi:hypothetical protein